ncbi:C40 family peptidase [Nocardioides sp. URHA0020]|uniref:C40 family peptidase n=1 Tax=Nocardioides sp. URHA0020 TaxID=1380392 RepID=UPI0006841C64|nr:C40 family peptidase [Nocardioides sp. URHA0020]
MVAAGLASGIAVADDDTVPSRQDVADARTAVRAQVDDVASVRARLAVANQDLQTSAVAAAQAAEAYNGARWHADRARRAAARATTALEAAEADVRRQRQAYTDSLVTSYELAPQLTALSAVVHSDGIDSVLQRSVTMANANDALDGNYDELRAAAVVADVARDRAERARAGAEKAERSALKAKTAAQQAADAAAADAQAIAAQKATLIARLADLEHVSVDLAQRRQSALEARAARAAAAAAAREQAAQAAATAAAAAEAKPAPAPEPQSAPSAEAGGEPAPQPAPEPELAPEPAPAAPAPVASAPSPRSGAQAAIAFARAQIGEPYRWGAAGPDAWDCSGLTAGAWAAGGTYLPHYSVAQYEQSTSISASQLRPGDLVFWGSSNDPGSIYHVALYVGDGRIIEAPRTGVPVQEVSMYGWITPNFYARP